MADTPPGGDCLLNPLSCWKIKYSIPNPKTITYRYPSESPVTVIADSYTLENVGASYPTPADRWYAVNGWIDLDVYPWWSPNSPVRVRYYQTQSRVLIGGDNAIITGAELPFVNVSGVLGGNYLYSFLVYYKSLGFSQQNSTTIVCGGNAAFGNTTLRAFGVDFINERGDPPPGQCRFTLKDASGSVLLQRTRDVCPEVTVNECGGVGQTGEIELKPIDRLHPVGLLPRLLIKTVNVSGYVCKRVAILYNAVVEGTPFEREIATFCSPKGCQKPPSVDYDCDNDCGCKRCPSGTCFACRDGDYICCYGENGTVLERFPSAEKCKNQDVC